MAQIPCKTRVIHDFRAILDQKSLQNDKHITPIARKNLSINPALFFLHKSPTNKTTSIHPRCPLVIVRLVVLWALVFLLLWSCGPALDYSLGESSWHDFKVWPCPQPCRLGPGWVGRAGRFHPCLGSNPQQKREKESTRSWKSVDNIGAGFLLAYMEGLRVEPESCFLQQKIC